MLNVISQRIMLETVLKLDKLMLICLEGKSKQLSTENYCYCDRNNCDINIF